MKKTVKLAIHHRKGSFSERWIEYCKKNNILYKMVDCYRSDILKELKDCDGLMWHWHQGDQQAMLFATKMICSLEEGGKKVFPSFKTCWHFDDKVGQKYLLEAIDAPLVPTYVFYDRNVALRWVDETIFPKVFKLRGGAGAVNVKLVKNKFEARKIINQAFGRGFRKFDRIAWFKDKLWHFKRAKNWTSVLGICKGLARLFVPTKLEITGGRDKGYVYFQEFIPNNTFDIRVIVIGKRAFAIKRMVRENDFRASGSGKIVYDSTQIPLDCVKIAFETSRKLAAQCIGYDFVFDGQNYNIIEISYGFVQEGYDLCPGYWDENLQWYEGKFLAQGFMVEDFCQEIQNNYL